MEISTANEQKADQLKQQGNDCFKRKLFNKAVYFYTQAIEADPNNSVIWSNRAQTYLNLHKPEKAYMDACGALQRDPNNHKALFRRAQALNKLGLKKRAHSDAVRCAQLDPKNKEAVELAKALENAQDADIVELTVFQRPEPIQSEQPLVKKQFRLVEVQK